jgi:hypothetical protein
VYSPISHTHPIAEAGHLDPLDHNIWLPFDEPMMRNAYGLIVAMMDGWQTSYGLRVEIDWFKSHGRPIVYLEPPPSYVPFAPGHTDLMVSPEALDAWLEKNPEPPSC